MKKVFRIMLPVVVLVFVGGFCAWLFLRTMVTASPEDALQAGERLFEYRRVLVVVAHPDDLEWYLGGTIGRFTREGAEVRAIVGTDGEAGRDRIGVGDLRETRRREARNAAEILGISEIYLPGLPDRGLPEASEEFSDAVIGAWERFSPDVVFTFDPELPALPYLHRDHTASGRVAQAYWVTLPPPRAALYYFHTRRPSVAVDIGDVIDVKLRALAAHRTQGLGGGQEFVRERNRQQGARVGVEYAELLRPAR